MPNRIPFDINWLQENAQVGWWLKTTALAALEHWWRGRSRLPWAGHVPAKRASTTSAVAGGAPCHETAMAPREEGQHK